MSLLHEAKCELYGVVPVVDTTTRSTETESRDLEANAPDKGCNNSFCHDLIENNSQRKQYANVKLSTFVVFPKKISVKSSWRQNVSLFSALRLTFVLSLFFCYYSNYHSSILTRVYFRVRISMMRSLLSF